jgi:regulator of protease activity HflC (stomatin/prohibitin superfamily)
VLVEDRAAFIQSFRDELQSELDGLRTGIRLAAIAVEAIHPPPDAAVAYHAVLASDIQARTSIAESRGSAVQQEAQARQTAQSTRDAAAVSAAEIVAQARSQSQTYAADFTAWERDGAASLLERRLERIGKVLPAAQTVIVDHHLSSEDLPLLDLRSMPAVP